MPEGFISGIPDRYAVEREIGRGGMATVYLALDRKHDRKVAIKTLRPELVAALGPERFLREIRLTAKLNHPNILSLIDSGDAGGVLYYITPFIEGESLRDRLVREGRLPFGEAARLAVQIARALAYAHRQGVVHRDIKPANVLLHEGNALVADFGIARSPLTSDDERLTGTGILVGTPAYMSPEQVNGTEELDHRSDIFSLGCLLYEMLVGEPPHRGPSVQAILAKRVVEPPPLVRRVRPEIPRTIERALSRALATSPDDRFPSAADFITAIELQGETAAPPTQAASIAVLPFSNVGSDPANEYFSEGVTEDIITQLSKISAFKVISRTSSMRYRTGSKPVRQIGTELGVGALVEGSVRRAANRIRVTVQLVDAVSDVHLWAETYDRELSDVFGIQTDIALRVATALRTALTAGERSRVGHRGTDNVEAYDLYLLGRHHANKRSDEGLDRAVHYFRQAIERDSGYAAAFAGLADAYMLSRIGYRASPFPDALSLAKEAALRALSIDETDPDAHTSLAYLHTMEWNWADAELAFERAIELNPSHARAHQWYAHYLGAVRQFDRSLVEATRARDLDPLSVVLTNELGWAHAFLRDFDRARSQHSKAIEMDPGFGMGYYNLGCTYLSESRFGEAIPLLERAVELTGGLWVARAALAATCARVGQSERARDLLGELRRESGDSNDVQMWIAFIEEALGEAETALDCLERAYRGRAPFLSVMGTPQFPFPSICAHPRFLAIFAKMGLPAH